MTAMCTFIEDYHDNPTQTIATARESASLKSWYHAFDEEHIYDEIASSEFRLYEEIVMCI